jgi:hypothetical protein
VRWRRIKDENEHSKVMNLDDFSLKEIMSRDVDEAASDEGSIIKFVAKLTTKKQKVNLFAAQKRLGNQIIKLS